ncbi:hypothetical protein ZYGM_001848 [Zygosaccharomyces mellis]|uniref:Uncharacterized protein n=1 Tax=Zygosaccharomyces mellis TaxID=42258 RepID=A0A4C2EC95_9SACH|nr:hypothetical protein ZYGM_001848 [Zygosaccharomyces mellis]
MDSRIYWFVAVFSYIIQTKCLSLLQWTARDSGRPDIDHQGVSIFLSFMYFVPWLLLVPGARLLTLSGWFTVSRPVTPESRALDENGGLMDNENNNNNSTGITAGNYISYDNGVKRNDIFGKLSYVIKLVVLSLLLLIVVFTYMNSLSLTPAFDVALIQNTSIFEITSLLYGVCGLSRRKNVFRNFIVMMIALVGIVLVSYTKATCDLLAGKVSINQNTGEIDDPFLFDRLKSCLLCGLGALALGPFMVLWNRWFNYSDRITISHQSQHLTFIASICMAVFLPFLPRGLSTVAKIPTTKVFWLGALASVFFGTLPHVFSLSLIQRQTLPSYSTTINLGAIIFMGISDWICEPTQTTIVRWEVIGYIMLSVSCVVLSIAYYEKKHISLY